MNRALREVGFFVVLFFILALGIHMDKWLSAPMTHLHALSNHALPFHPLIYTLVVYIGLTLLRTVFGFLVRLIFGRKG